MTMEVGKNWPNVADLVPHTGVARLLTNIVASAPDVVEATGVIPPGHPLAADGLAPAFLAIELGAQAAAAMESLGRPVAPGRRAARQLGSLVRVREARFERALLPVDVPIHVTARLEAAAPPLAIYRIVSTLYGAAVLDAVISTHAGPIGGRS